MASVTYDPAEVGEDVIRAAISEADRRSAAEGEATPEGDGTESAAGETTSGGDEVAPAEDQ